MYIVCLAIYTLHKHQSSNSKSCIFILVVRLTLQKWKILLPTSKEQLSAGFPHIAKPFKDKS